jgi:hypothetical protein
MGNYILILAVKDNVADVDRGRLDGLHGDRFVLPDGGIHAPTRRMEAHALALAQQLLAQVCEEMDGSKGDGGFKILHGEYCTLEEGRKKDWSTGVMEYWSTGKGRMEEEEDRR